jgi:hypothetical protein
MEFLDGLPLSLLALGIPEFTPSSAQTSSCTDVTRLHVDKHVVVNLPLRFIIYHHNNILGICYPAMSLLDHHSFPV